MVVQDTSTCLLGLSFLGLGIVGFCLSLMRLLGPPHPAKAITPAFLWLTGGWIGIGLSLYLAGKTWHLPHHQNPFLLSFTGGGLGIVFMVIGLLKIVQWQEDDYSEGEAGSEEPPTEGVWPPAPHQL